MSRAFPLRLPPPAMPAPIGAASRAILSARSMSDQNRAEMRQVFARAVQLAERGRVVVRVPHETKAVYNRQGMHYHYRPEIFLQLQGFTDFSFPHEGFRLGPDEVCIVPAGIPHGELVYAEPGRAFRNLVAGFYNNALSLHFAYEASPQKPDIDVIEFFDAPDLQLYLTLTNSLVQTHGMHSPARDSILRGLTIALLGLFRNLVEAGSGHLNNDEGKVFQAKCIVREQFANSELSVQHIAETLGCSADYLSHLFRTETNERLTHYIQRIRVAGALLALESTTLTVSEIAYASGFTDPAYFARVFRQHKSMTPQEFRARVGEQRRVEEHRPKTVYFDREDYSPGAPVERPPEGAASASA
jgi:AraC-like DNA-binding protein/mannose-6-phosphate isomerase-like protein (cupin superfamily)